MTIHCETHGTCVAAVVCGHMIRFDGAPCGFIENSSDPDDLQAWCHACEDKFQQEGGMTDAFREFTQMAVVCVECYRRAKSHHAIPLQ